MIIGVNQTDEKGYFSTGYKLSEIKNGWNFHKFDTIWLYKDV